MRYFHKAGSIFFSIILLLSAVIYPGFMAILSAAGWLYNVRAGNYPPVFRSYAVWMLAGSLLLLTGTVLCLLGKRFRRCNVPAAVSAIAGCAACLATLYQLMAYADQHFPGIGESMQPVSALYRDRLLPVLLPAVLIVGCSICRHWQTAHGITK